MQSDKYWALRALQREQEAYDSTTDVIHHLHAIYFDAAARLADMARYIFGNFAKSAGGMIDPDKARALLSTQETAEVLEKLRKEYADTGNPEALAKLNAPAYAYRISRVQAMRRAVDAEVQTLAEMETQIGAPHLAKTYDNTYYKTLYDRAREPEGILIPESAAPSVPAGKPGTSASVTEPAFDRLSDRAIQQALENRWHGANYSERVWANTQQVAKEAGRIIDAGVTAGASVQNMTAELKDLMGVAWYAAERLIRTETARMLNDARLRSFRTMGVQWYEWVGTLDARTCELCGALDGQHFRLPEAITGKTLPPRHPNCRCVIVSYFPDDKHGGQRIALDPVTGKIYRIPENTTYEEWRKGIAEKYGDDALEKAQRRYRNLKADSAEQQRMRKILPGKVPSKIADFQEMKYNKSNEWESLKQAAADKKIQIGLRSDEQAQKLHVGRQNKHIPGMNEYKAAKSRLTISRDDAQALVKKYAGHGQLLHDTHGYWNHKELIVSHPEIIGTVVDEAGQTQETSKFIIHYSKDGAHIVPTLREEKKP